MPSLRLGLAQCRQTADFGANARTIFRFLENAARQGIRLLCFPETQTVGYRVDVAFPPGPAGTPGVMPVPVAELEELHGRVAKRCGELGIACVLGTETPLGALPEAAHARPYNSALIITERGEIAGVHHKTRLTPLDAVAYTAGPPRFGVYELAGVRVGVVICFEGFRFGKTTRACVAQGAQLVLHPQNNTTRPNDWKVPVHHAMIVTRAAENTVWFASCNCCYEQHQNCRSMVVAPDGQVHAQAELRREELLVADIDPDRATRAMYLFDKQGCADVLFGDTVRPVDYAASGAMRGG